MNTSTPGQLSAAQQQIGRNLLRNHEGGEDDIIAVQNPGQAPDVVGTERWTGNAMLTIVESVKRQESAEPRYLAEPTPTKVGDDG